MSKADCLFTVDFADGEKSSFGNRPTTIENFSASQENFFKIFRFRFSEMTTDRIFWHFFFRLEKQRKTKSFVAFVLPSTIADEWRSFRNSINLGICWKTDRNFVRENRRTKICVWSKDPKKRRTSFAHRFVVRLETNFERCKCITGDIKCRFLYIVEKFIEFRRSQNNFSQFLDTNTFT